MRNGVSTAPHSAAGGGPSCMACRPVRRTGQHDFAPLLASEFLAGKAAGSVLAPTSRPRQKPSIADTLPGRHYRTHDPSASGDRGPAVRQFAGSPLAVKSSGAPLKCTVFHFRQPWHQRPKPAPSGSRSQRGKTRARGAASPLRQALRRRPCADSIWSGPEVLRMDGRLCRQNRTPIAFTTTMRGGRLVHSSTVPMRRALRTVRGGYLFRVFCKIASLPFTARAEVVFLSKALRPRRGHRQGRTRPRTPAPNSSDINSLRPIMLGQSPGENGRFASATPGCRNIKGFFGRTGRFVLGAKARRI